MTDEINAKVAAKGCKSTGITDDDARRFHARLGTKQMAIVELTSAAKTEKADGSESVTLNIVNIELAPSPATEDHLRELQRAFYYERGIEDGQRALDASIEPKVSDVLASGERFQPHPYLSGALALDGQVPICDVCGLTENAPPHTQYAADTAGDGFTDSPTPDDGDEDQSDACDGEDGEDSEDLDDHACADCGHLIDDCTCEEAQDEDEATVTTLPGRTLTDPFTPNPAS